jgi:molybdenum cofactor cytidylyltransferase
MHYMKLRAGQRAARTAAIRCRNDGPAALAGNQIVMAQSKSLVGILLAAGRGRRFDPAGKQDKLLQALPTGQAVVLEAASNLLAAASTVIAVVRHRDDAVADLLRDAGCRVVACPDADDGMASSLRRGLGEAKDCDGWVIALGDMPFVDPQTIRLLMQGIGEGATIAVPVHQGRRGNPVAFGRALLPNLLVLSGDRGARALLGAFPVLEVPVADTGIFRDIDLPSDLER